MSQHVTSIHRHITRILPLLDYEGDPNVFADRFEQAALAQVLKELLLTVPRDQAFSLLRQARERTKTPAEMLDTSFSKEQQEAAAETAAAAALEGFRWFVEGHLRELSPARRRQVLTYLAACA